ncbi:hypothetical protein ACQ4LE_005776 [Meloidogyne hapla]|uniref:HTH psq-type domain-containing protein n=1 Tax=Meloidogyne hapla TaxID=6305 RepID=A0A1I8B587_MELHA
MHSNSYNFNSNYNNQQHCNMQDMSVDNLNGKELNSDENIPKLKPNEEEDEDDEEMDDEDEEEEEEDDEEEEDEDELIGSGYDENLVRNGDELGEGVIGGDVSPNPEDDEKILVPKGELASIKANLQMLNHQMSILIRTLNVQPCGCKDCGITAMKTQAKSLLNGSYRSENQSSSDKHNYDNSIDWGESTQRGRRSKYCTAAEKKTVAGFVQLHGATAAARKFNIPPAVAAYYHRREFKNSVHNRVGRPAGRFSIGPSKTHDPSSGEVRERTASLTAMPTSENKNGEESSKNGNQNLAQLWQNATGSQNSSVNAYLRGRGRGRPKLIGDELDAELVEHIVKMKQKSPNAHLTASHALTIARNYIASKSPGLLEENGGQVKLKITWAMKLVTRVQEREREIQLGLPPGTLQNLPRSFQDGSEISPALVDELLGQGNNFLNSQLNVGAILAAATSSAGSTNEDKKNIVTGCTTGQTDAAMINAMLGMAAAGNTSDLFGLMDHQQHAKSGGVTVKTEPIDKGINNNNTTRNAPNLMMEANSEEQDAAIRQLLASLQGGGRNDSDDLLGGRSNISDIDMAAALANCSG